MDKVYYFSAMDDVYCVVRYNDNNSKRYIISEDDLGGYLRCLRDLGYKEGPVEIHDIRELEFPPEIDVETVIQPHDASKSTKHILALY